MTARVASVASMAAREEQGRGEAADSADVIRLPIGRIHRRRVLAGLINEYERAG